jgi:hypothetical protein
MRAFRTDLLFSFSFAFFPKTWWWVQATAPRCKHTWLLLIVLCTNEGVWEQGVKENIWTKQRWSDRRLLKLHNEELPNLYSAFYHQLYSWLFGWVLNSSVSYSGDSGCWISSQKLAILTEVHVGFLLSLKTNPGIIIKSSNHFLRQFGPPHISYLPTGYFSKCVPSKNLHFLPPPSELHVQPSKTFDLTPRMSVY